MVKYFARHYSTFCERMILYDDASTDGTREIAMRAGAEVRDCPWGGLDDIRAIDLASTQYREAEGEADWVIWVDCDEFIYHPRGIAQRLLELKADGVQLPRVDGYSMVAENPPSGPSQIYDEIRTGFPDEAYSKPCVFDPSIGITWTTGRHVARATVPLQETSDPLRLLHYRYLGRRWHLERNARNFGHLTELNKAMMHGMETYPGATGKHTPVWYAEQVKLAQNCVDR